MHNIFNVNTDLDVPIYQQLVDEIQLAIKKEILLDGQQLPTVSQLTQMLGVARGTVKRAYDELEHTGFIEKVQGRGTFVSYHSDKSSNRKERAMTAIGNMLDSLEEMGLSPSEINIFVNLMLRERFEKQTNIKVAAVECNPENLSEISKQLRHINGVDLYSFLLEDIKKYPYKLDDNFDLIIATSSHTKYLESVIPGKSRVVRVALRPATSFLSRIIKLSAGKKVGIIVQSERFGELLYETCQMYSENIILQSPLIFSHEANIKKYLKENDIILLPESYEKYLSTQAVEAIRKFDGEIIECYYEMDEGSLLYLETKIKHMFDQKNI